MMAVLVFFLLGNWRAALIVSPGHHYGTAASRSLSMVQTRLSGKSR